MNAFRAPTACVRCRSSRPPDGPSPRSGYKPGAYHGPGRSKAERNRRAAVVEEHRRRFGEWCPGWGVPPHAVTPPNRLSGDHTIPRAEGGEASYLRVICVSCNARRGRKAL